MENAIRVIKKDGTLQDWKPGKIVAAAGKAAASVQIPLSDAQYDRLIELVGEKCDDYCVRGHSTNIPVATIHEYVIDALELIDKTVADCYRQYRLSRIDVSGMFQRIRENVDRIYATVPDRTNANRDSMLVATRRCMTAGAYNREMYEQYFMPGDILKAKEDGYIYVHDEDARLDTINCCLFRVGDVMKDGFAMNNQWYTEPKTLVTGYNVLTDIVFASAGQQYGGFTVPQIDKILAPYVEKSLKKHEETYAELMRQAGINPDPELMKQYVESAVEREAEQGYQGLEMRLNTVASSRGDYPFVTLTFGLGTSWSEKLITRTILRVHKEGQGRPGFKKATAFPKLVFLYDKNIHGTGCCNNDLFEEGIACSAKTMYPDWLSLTGEGYVAEMYKKHGLPISPMGCRAFLSPWYERGGMHPADEKDVPVFEGRFNMGVVSLNLPMIYRKAREEQRDFHEVLDYYLGLIRRLHKLTIEYLGTLRASCNPIAFCEGGLLGGHLKPDEPIRPLLKSATISFGYTALNELQQLHNGKSLVTDGQFALETLAYINEKVEEYKREDNILYAVYGTPAESLCGKQAEQFRKKYGIVKNVSDRAYVSNSFHCHVSETISPIEKQDLEHRFWNLSNGGKIQYVRYPLGYNIGSVRTLVTRAMDMGFYEGVNLNICSCENCGFELVDMGDTCPKCGSKNIRALDRMNGYLSYSRVGEVNRTGYADSDAASYDSSSVLGKYNAAKAQEIMDRVSM